MASTIIPINPLNFNIEELSSQDQSILTPNLTDGKAIYGKSKIEFHIYDLNNNIISSNNDISEWNISTDLSLSKNPNSNENTTITLDPEINTINSGYNFGTYNVLYNFTEYLFGSSPENQYYIDDISSDRTEIRIINNFIPTGSLQVTYDDFKLKYGLDTFFDEFYINFGSNNLYLGTNILIDNTNNVASLFIKLYEPLPLIFDVKTQLWVVTKTAESIAFNIALETPSFEVDNITTIAGPNTNIQTKNQLANPSPLFSYNTLVSSSLSSSKDQLKSYLYDNSVDINIDYNSYNNFIFYSSAANRLNNFYLKAQEIENYNNDITTYNTLVATPQVSNSIALLETKISDIIEKFDGYEYFLYFTSGSYAWPKTNSEPPYTLASTGSNAVLNWYGSDIYGSTYYGGQLLSASEYDINNADLLVNLVPDYLKEGTYESQKYLTFINMIAQSFDNVWIYINNITSKFNADNRLDYGASPELVADILRSFGLPIYTNNFSTPDSYLNLLGYGADGQLYPTGSEKIDLIITSSANPLSQNELNLQTYKRLLHNLPYLYSKKGSVEAIRILATIFGVPDTILQISEFGGQDEINYNDYDYWYNQYNYAYNTSGSGFISSSWVLNTQWNSLSDNPQAVEFRFKTSGLPTDTGYYSQSLWSTDLGVNIRLRYTGSGYTSGSYSGSIIDPYYQYALLDFIPNSASLSTSCSVYLPFYNGGWWSVLLNKNGTNYTLYAANKSYTGDDGNTVGFQASASLSAAQDAWNNSVTSYFATSSLSGKIFSGSLQEIRYYTAPISQNDFNDYVMNPYSIEGDGTITAPETLAFRASLGGELYSGSTSIHPKVSGSWEYTSSFASNSNFYTGSGIFVNNYEYFFLNQFPAGIKNRVSNKIRPENNVLPYSASTDYLLNNNTPNNNVLSAFRSVQQNVPQSGSYTPDINYVEVGFSPQNVINNDIASQLGYFNLGEYIGDPRQISESRVTYQDLDVLRNYYFEKYYKNYDWTDFIRLIQFYDNSLFKLIKDFTPSRSGLASGIIIKQSVLERNKYPVPQVDTYTTTSYYATGSNSNPSWSVPNVFQSLQLTGSIDSISVWNTASQTNVLVPSVIESITGSNGGSLPSTWFPNGTTVYSTGSQFLFITPGPPAINFSTFILTASAGNYLLTMDVLSNTAFNLTDKLYVYDSDTLVYGDDPNYTKVLSLTFPTTTTQSISASFSAELGTVMTFDYSSNPDFIYVNNIVLTSYPYSYDFDQITIETPLGPTTGSLTNSGYFDGELSGSEIDVDNNGNLLPNPLLAPEFVASIPSLQSLSVRTSQSATAKYPSSSYDIYADSLSAYILTSSGLISYSVVSNAQLYPSYSTSSFKFTPTYDCVADITIFLSGSMYGDSLLNTPYGSGYFSASFLEEIGGNKQEFFIFGPFSGIGPGAGGLVNISQSANFQNITLKGGYTYSVGYNFLIDSFPVGGEDITGSINTSSFWNISIVNPADAGFPNDPSITQQQLFPGDLEIYGDYNAIYNNVYSNRLSSKYYDVDYAALGDKLPVNQALILSSSATFAQIQDSNYTLASNANPRYNGCKNTSAKYNTYTPSGSAVPLVLGTASFWPGDQSYGKTAAIDKYAKYFALFDWVVSSDPEYPGGGNIHIINLIDTEGNVIILDSSNNNLFEVSQTFKKGEFVSAYQISGSSTKAFPLSRVIEGGATFQTIAARSGSGFGGYIPYFTSSLSLTPYLTSSFTLTGSSNTILTDVTSSGWLYPFLTGSSTSLGVLYPGQGLILGGTSLFIYNPQSGSYYGSEGVVAIPYNVDYDSTYLPLQPNDYIRFGSTTTSSDSSYFGLGLYQIGSFETGSDYNFTSSINIYKLSGSTLPSPATQNWRMFRRIPDQNYVLVQYLPPFVSKGLLIPQNWNPNLDPIGIAKKSGLL